MSMLTFEEFLDELKTPREGGLMTPKEKAERAKKAKEKKDQEEK